MFTIYTDLLTEFDTVSTRVLRGRNQGAVDPRPTLWDAASPKMRGYKRALLHSIVQNFSPEGS